MSHDVLDRLTPRERQVLSLLAEGRTNKEIAAALGLALGTVKVYISRIFERVHVQNRTQLAALAFEHRAAGAAAAAVIVAAAAAAGSRIAA